MCMELVPQQVENHCELQQKDINEFTFLCDDLNRV